MICVGALSGYDVTIRLTLNAWLIIVVVLVGDQF